MFYPQDEIDVGEDNLEEWYDVAHQLYKEAREKFREMDASGSKSDSHLVMQVSTLFLVFFMFHMFLKDLHVYFFVQNIVGGYKSNIV